MEMDQGNGQLLWALGSDASCGQVAHFWYGQAGCCSMEKKQLILKLLCFMALENEEVRDLQKNKH